MQAQEDDDMRIGFDVSQTAEGKAGCGYVADQLIRHLALLDSQNEYLLYPTFYLYRDPEYHRVTAPPAHNMKMHFNGVSFREMVHGWETRMEDRSAWLGSPDIIHSNNFSCIKDHRAKTVFVIYDIAFLVHPEFTSEENRLVCFDGLFNASMYADHCIAISEFTKNSFLQYFPHYPEDRVTVMYLGTRPTIAPVQDESLKKKVMKKYGLRDDFWLGVGTIEPRKNYRLLIDAFCELNDSRQLVIAGGKGWLESDLGDKVARMGIQDRVKFLGYVTDEELSVLYSSCFAFIYPSFYEGFGLPVLEAMSCGAAIISSSSSSLPEVGGDAVLYMDPYSRDSLIEKMKLLAGDPQLRKEMRSKSISRAGLFSWQAAAQNVLTVYEKTLRMKPWYEE
jgi:glycosyltransferase involved in cell wall biosynthesis